MRSRRAATCRRTFVEAGEPAVGPLNRDEALLRASRRAAKLLSNAYLAEGCVACRIVNFHTSEAE